MDRFVVLMFQDIMILIIPELLEMYFGMIGL